MIQNTPIVCSGLMFIGDPHLDEAQPRRRLDQDFSATILGKLEFLFDYCSEHDLVPVILGDIFEPENKVRVSNPLLNRFVRATDRSKHKIITNVGNHDKKHDILTDADSLMTLKNTRVLHVLDEAGPAAEFLINGTTVGLGASPYGQSIPTDVTGMFPTASSIIWITHHDLAFESPYPGSQPIHAIRGCSLVINGHMHLHKKPLKIGQTTWFNPGNITRQYIDAIEHVPAVHILKTGKLEKLVVPHQTGIFDLTGKLIDAVSPGEVPKDGKQGGTGYGDLDTDFVALLAAEDSLEMSRSDDGSILKEEIDAKFERDQTPNEIRGLIMHLFDKTIEKAREEAA
jgi:DNA repair exonuclease SbcCD nuclease subunit